MTSAGIRPRSPIAMLRWRAHARTASGRARYRSTTSAGMRPRSPMTTLFRRAHARMTDGRARYSSMRWEGIRPRSAMSMPFDRAQSRTSAGDHTNSRSAAMTQSLGNWSCNPVIELSRIRHAPFTLEPRFGACRPVTPRASAAVLMRRPCVLTRNPVQDSTSFVGKASPLLTAGFVHALIAQGSGTTTMVVSLVIYATRG